MGDYEERHSNIYENVITMQGEYVRLNDNKMLQQILQDMYIDPEILAELDEEQKQILFCRMREEQVRRWKEWEKKSEEEDKKKKKVSPKAISANKQIQFLLAEDGNPWVWVMGEHKDDKSIDDLLEQDVRQEADLAAQKEAEELQKREEEKLMASLKAEQEALERERRAREQELKRKAEEAALHQSRKEAQELAKKLEEEKKQQEDIKRKQLQEMNRKIEKHRRTSTASIIEEKEKRSNEIYSTLRTMHENIAKLAEQGHPLIEQAWKEQEKKSKQAEIEKRTIARKAREEHRKSLSLKTESMVISQFIGSLQSVRNAAGYGKENQKPAIAQKPTAKPRAVKPPNISAVVKWYQDEEIKKGSGLDPRSNAAATWFHGIISRQEAEDLLEEKNTGSFLVRVSEKVYGYAVSLKTAVRCKHFLIDVSPDGYKFFGVNQKSHLSLWNLVKFYEANPISVVGQELLSNPCGQAKDPPDTAPLFCHNTGEVSYL